MVGKFAGWLMYFPALAELCVNVPKFCWWHSSTVSLMLHDLNFPVAWFSMCRECPSCLVWTILYPGLQSEIPFSWLFVFKVDSVTFLERWWFSIHGFLGSPEAVLHLVFSLQWLGLVDGLPGWVVQILDHLRTIALIQEVHVRVGLYLCHRQEKNGVSSGGKVGHVTV